MGAALVSLVAGFFIHYSTIPLLISIGFSVSATVLIMVGWARRRKLEDEVEFASPQIEEIEEGGMRVDDFADEADRYASTTELVVTEAEATSKVEAEPRPARKAARSRGARTATPRGRKVVVIPGRDRYHTPACRFAKSDAAEKVTQASARSRGFAPCSVCKPD